MTDISDFLKGSEKRLGTGTVPGKWWREPRLRKHEQQRRRDEWAGYHNIYMRKEETKWLVEKPKTKKSSS